MYLSPIASHDLQKYPPHSAAILSCCKTTVHLLPIWQAVRAPYRPSTAEWSLAWIVLNWPSAMRCRASQGCSWVSQAMWGWATSTLKVRVPVGWHIMWETQ